MHEQRPGRASFARNGLWLDGGKRSICGCDCVSAGLLREIWHAIRLLLKFLEMPAILLLRDTALLADVIPFPVWCERIVLSGDARSTFRTVKHIIPGGSLVCLPPWIACAPWFQRPPVRLPRGRTGAAMTWIASDCAGILLMLCVVRRLDVTRLIRKPEFARLGGARALSFLLAGIGMTLLKRWTPVDPVEPAVAIFSGMFPEPDLAGLRQFFSSTEVSVIADFVQGGNLGGSAGPGRGCPGPRICEPCSRISKGFPPGHRQTIHSCPRPHSGGRWAPVGGSWNLLRSPSRFTFQGWMMPSKRWSGWSSGA